MTRHLDLDDLADVLVGEATPGSAAHVRSCPRCTSALTELEQAQAPVRAALAALPEPEVPADLPARLDAALLRAREAEERLRARRTATSRYGARLLAVAACAVAAVGLGVAGLGSLVGSVLHGAPDGAASPSGASAAGTTGGLAVPLVSVPTPPPAWATGTDYAAGTPVVLAALAGLLGRPGGAAARTAPAEAARQEGLARLHDARELEGCLRALAGGATPLALDYAAYRGTPALVVVLPSPVHGQVDVEVVAAACDADDAHLLLTSRLPRPA